MPALYGVESARRLVDDARERACHAGWLLCRPLGPSRVVANGAATNLETAKDAVLETIIQAARRGAQSDLYRQAWKRWLALTSLDTHRFASATWRTATRVLIGTSAANALETGAALHHSYGVPYLPGSALKGCARAYAEAQGIDRIYIDELFGREPPRRKHASRDAAATAALSGCVIFHDAWWVPPLSKNDAGRGPLEREIATTHHTEYYSGAGEATDFDSPVPSPMLAAVGDYYFVVEGVSAWASAALRLLHGALAQWGVGAKRSTGYGLFVTDGDAPPVREAAERARQWLGSAQRDRERQLAQLLTPRQRVEQAVHKLDPNALAQKLSKDRNEWLRELGIDASELRTILQQTVPSDVIQFWKSRRSLDKHARKALNFLSTQESDESDV